MIITDSLQIPKLLMVILLVGLTLLAVEVVALPTLMINGSAFDRNVGDPSYQSITIDFDASHQTWSLFNENAGWRDYNAFGYYTGLADQSNPSVVFAGLDSSPFQMTTSIDAFTDVGLWLSPNGNTPYLYSQTGSSFQPFYVYDVSQFRGTGASYNFVNGWQSYGFRGDYDYLIFVDDGGAGPDYDYNDMMIGVTADAVPEPATMLLFSMGLAGVAFMRRRKK